MREGRSPRKSTTTGRLALVSNQYQPIGGYQPPVTGGYQPIDTRPPPGINLGPGYIQPQPPHTGIALDAIQRQYQQSLQLQKEMQYQFLQSHQQSQRQTQAIVDLVNQGIYNPFQGTRLNQTWGYTVDNLLQYQTFQLMMATYIRALPEIDRIRIIEKQIFNREISITKQENKLDVALRAFQLFLVGSLAGQPIAGTLLLQMGTFLNLSPEMVLTSEKATRKTTTNSMKYGRVLSRSAPALLALLALQAFKPSKDIRINDMGIVEFGTDQLKDIEEIPAPYRGSEVTINTHATQVQTKFTENSVTLRQRTRTPQERKARVQHGSLRDYKLGNDLKPYPGLPMVRLTTGVQMNAPTIQMEMELIPPMKWEVTFEPGFMMQLKAVRLKENPRNKTKVKREENKRRQDRKNHSSRAYIGALRLTTQTFGKISERLDTLDAIQNNTLVNVGGFWYSLGSLTLKKKLNPAIQAKLHAGDYVINWEQVIGDLMLNELIDRSVARLSHIERETVKQSDFWLNSYGKPSTWAKRL